jgi:hypothetical protein
VVHSEDADGGDNLQIWRIVLNILSKKLEAADKGWSGGPPVTHHMKCYAGPWILMNIGTMVSCFEHNSELSDSIKCRRSLDCLRDYELFKNSAASSE